MSSAFYDVLLARWRGHGQEAPYSFDIGKCDQIQSSEFIGNSENF